MHHLYTLIIFAYIELIYICMYMCFICYNTECTSVSKFNFISVTYDGRLHAWCKDGRYKKIEEFIQNYKDGLSAKLVYRRGVFGYTPIHEAVGSGHSKVLELLLEHGANPNCRANSGYTPLHLAASSGHVDCVRVLLANDADISKTDEYGKTPIQTAELSSKHGVMKILRSAGKLHLQYCVNDFMVSINYF